MQTREQKLAYLREYSKRNRERLREYKRNWMRNNRGGLKLKVKKEIIPHKTKDSKPIKGKCNMCKILLISQYATGHNGITCGMCLQIK